MRGWEVWGVVLVLCGCGRLGFAPQGDAGEPSIDGSEGGAPMDAMSPNDTDGGREAVADSATDGAATDGAATDGAAPFGPFGPPALVPGIVNAADALSPSFTADGLLIAWSSNVSGQPEIYTAERAGPEDAFEVRVRHPELNVSGRERTMEPALSADGLEIFYASIQVTPWQVSIWRAERSRRDEPFGGPEEVVSESGDFWDPDGPHLSGGGNELYFGAQAKADGREVLWRAVRSDRGSPFQTPERLDLGPGWQLWPALSDDGLELYFEGEALSGSPANLFRSTRSSIRAPFSRAEMLSELSLPAADDGDPELSAGGNLLYFSSDRGGFYQIFVAQRSRL